MNSAIKRLKTADEQLAIALSDLQLIHRGKKDNGDEVTRLLNKMEQIKTTIADVLTLALNRDILTETEKPE